MMQLGIGLLLGSLVALVAWRLGSLSTGGAILAAITGGFIFGLGGWGWASLMILFFVSSSLLSQLFSGRKKSLLDKFSKGSRRDGGQVLANGGAGVLLVVLLQFSTQENLLWIGYAGAMAAVTADTWATELGVLNRQSPRLITTGKAVEPGTSGAISTTGTLAAVGGGLLIALAAWLFTPSLTGRLLIIIPLAGVLGSFSDSLLGATWQAIYYCPHCAKQTERHPLHSCGTPTRLHKGWRWLSNDRVNLVCSLVGALAAMLLWTIM
jgi:uncharacterized protein (TIGR00297 family)